ncbi:hypothetical protein HBI38_157260 [Parastagonospora nodorum]|nr:hypothetical protein HBI10_152330 [Parastagonospora nodorum]KAH4012490.1 hypothetical protein HBI13_187020 [Parastagonospora nodorum]KAH4047608.1 hypothetical protein HBH49_167370 [Parastagonospora nodorum]KAH4962569.1 hypothetical protein HBI78_128420 [Parastagonospora nodorum]KAH5097331.1 hypothetical protein HBH72_127950 [Parastagonospora nodorum]
MGQRWYANHGKTPNRGRRLLDCQIRESAVANLHNQEAAELDWERGDEYEKPCLGRALGWKTGSGEMREVGQGSPSSGARSQVGGGLQAGGPNRLLQGCAWAGNRRREVLRMVQGHCR